MDNTTCTNATVTFPNWKDMRIALVLLLASLLLVAAVLGVPDACPLENGDDGPCNPEAEHYSETQQHQHQQAESETTQRPFQKRRFAFVLSSQHHLADLCLHLLSVDLPSLSFLPPLLPSPSTLLLLLLLLLQFFFACGRSKLMDLPPTYLLALGLLGLILFNVYKVSQMGQADQERNEPAKSDIPTYSLTLMLMCLYHETAGQLSDAKATS